MQADTDEWFLPAGAKPPCSGNVELWDWALENPASVYTREAVEACSHCPYRVECLTYALDRPYLEGLWGGMSTHERKRYRRQHGFKARFERPRQDWVRGYVAAARAAQEKLMYERDRMDGYRERATAAPRDGNVFAKKAG
jgi:hypothetical protein